MENDTNSGKKNGQAIVIRSLTKYTRLLGILLLVILLLNVDVRATFATLGTIEVWPLLVAILLNIPQLGLKALRWRFLLFLQGVRYRPLRAVLAYFSSIYMGLFTPGRLGEFVKAVYLKQDANLSVGEAMSSVLVDRLFDLYALIGAGAYGLFVFAALVKLPVWGLIIVAGGVSASLLLLYPPVGCWFVEMLAHIRFLDRIAAWLTPQVDNFYDKLRPLFRPKLLVAVILTLVAHTIFYLQCYLIALALRLPLQYNFVLFSMALVNLINLLPISISGLGTREAVLTLLFGSVGLPSEAAIAYAALVVVVFYAAAGLLGAVAWSAAPLRIDGQLVAIENVRELRGKL